MVQKKPVEMASTSGGGVLRQGQLVSSSHQKTGLGQRCKLPSVVRSVVSCWTTVLF